MRTRSASAREAAAARPRESQAERPTALKKLATAVEETGIITRTRVLREVQEVQRGATAVTNSVFDVESEPTESAMAAPTLEPATPSLADTNAIEAEPVRFEVPSIMRMVYEHAIMRALKTVMRTLPDGNAVVTGSAALWLADTEATWFPDDIDIPVQTETFYDLVGRLTMLGVRRVQGDKSGFCFEMAMSLPSGTALEPITVQVYPVHNVLWSVASHDLEAVRCYASFAGHGNLTLRVTWCDGVNVDKVLGLRRSNYYRPSLSCVSSKHCGKHEESRRRKYEERGYTIKLVLDKKSRCPYCDAKRGMTWMRRIVPEQCQLKSSKCPVNGLTLATLGYETPWINKVALRWLEQEWHKSKGVMDREALIALATPAPPPCPVDGAVLGEHEIAPVDRSPYLVQAQQEWLLSGCTATKDEILAALELWETDDLPELEDPSSSETEAEAMSEANHDEPSDTEQLLSNILASDAFSIQTADSGGEDSVPGTPAIIVEADTGADGSGVQEDGCVMM